MKLTDGLFGDELARCVDAEAQIRAISRVESALARCQAQLGIIPQMAADVIAKETEGFGIDPKNLLAPTATAGIAAQAVVAALKNLCGENGQWVHFGATSQDIEDTALMLCLSEVLQILQTRLAELDAVLTAKSHEFATLPIPARTRFQIAAPTSLGAKLAVWRSAIARHQERLNELRPRLLTVSFFGAAGTGAALPQMAEVRHALAKELNLAPTDMPWHAVRDNIVELAGWLALVTGSIGKIGADLIFLGQSEVGEISAGTGGGSSTMPQKSNPVAAEALVSIARLNAGAVGTIHQAMIHAQERDGSALAIEWQTLPDMITRTGAALRHATALAQSLSPNPDRIAQTFTNDRGAMMAEAAGFYLIRHMPRSDAQQIIRQALMELTQNPNETLSGLLNRSLPGHDWTEVLSPENNLGEAPNHANKQR